MKILALLLVTCIALPTIAQEPKSCVILKRSSGADHAFSGIEFYYVEGHYPQGYKFRTNLRGRHARKLDKMGAKMVILESKYTMEELQEARKSCHIQ